MTPKEDETSLGSVLLEMGVITEDQLRSALDRQENSTLEQLLGIVMVHEGFCTKDDIELALSAQKSLRGVKSREIKRAVAAMDFAIYRKTSNGARSQAIQKGEAFCRSRTGEGFPAVTSELLVRDGGK